MLLVYVQHFYLVWYDSSSLSFTQQLGKKKKAIVLVRYNHLCRYNSINHVLLHPETPRQQRCTKCMSRACVGGQKQQDAGSIGGRHTWLSRCTTTMGSPQHAPPGISFMSHIIQFYTHKPVCKPPLPPYIYIYICMHLVVCMISDIRHGYRVYFVVCLVCFCEINVLLCCITHI